MTTLTIDQVKAVKQAWAQYAVDPVSYVDDIFGTVMWSKQRAILESVAENERTAVRACHASGKTFAAANVALWWLTTRAPSMVISTAPTQHQVKDLLWSEINKLYAISKIPIGGECLTLRLNIAADHYAVGLSTNDPQKFQGFHCPNILVIVDEANAVEETIFDAIDGILSTSSDDFPDIGNVRLLLIGNPIINVGTFYDAFKDPNYKKIHISAFDTPQFTGEDVPARVVAQLTSKKWVQERADEWGEDNPLYQARVLGEFPGSAEDAVIAPLSWSQAAVQRATAPQTPDVIGDFIQLGCDVARLGKNRTVFCWRRGPAVLGFQAHAKTKINEVNALARELCIKLRNQYNLPIYMVFDQGGLGAGAVDTFEPPAHTFFGGVEFGAKASEPLRFRFLREQMYWTLREYLEPGGTRPDLIWVAAGPESERCQAQLADIRYTYNARGVICLETKEKMAERGAPSPDEADAAVLAFCPMDRLDARAVQIGEMVTI